MSEFSHWACAYCGLSTNELWRSCCGEVHFEAVNEEGEPLPDQEKYL